MRVKLTFILKAESVAMGPNEAGAAGAGFAAGKIFEYPVYEVTKTIPAPRLRVYLSKVRRALAGFTHIMDMVSNSMGRGS